MDELKALTEKDSWLAHTPLPRVIEILIQNVASSHILEEQLIMVVPYLCVTSGKYSKECLKLIQQIPSESTVWDRLVEAFEEEKLISDHLLIEIYKQRPPTLAKHILESFDILSDIVIQQVNQLLENSSDKMGVNSIYVNYLSHTCPVADVTWEIKYNFLPVAIGSCKAFLYIFLSISNLFLDNCNYSVTSIKVVNLFYSLFKNKICLYQEPLFDFIAYDLIAILSDPPCLICNNYLSCMNDLELMAKNVKTLLTNSRQENLGLIRTLLSMHCEWLIFLKNCPEVRSMFMQSIDFS